MWSERRCRKGGGECDSEAEDAMIDDQSQVVVVGHQANHALAPN